jgi:hypothetical protein
MRTLKAALVAALLLLAGAPAAFADSIAYVKDGNVWLSTPDGARQFQVTASGGYSDVSQADDGTMIALNGVRLHRLDRMGNVLADFDTPVSDTRPAPEKTFYGPFDPAISPDGTKVAYTYYWMTQSQSPTCFPPTCVTTINEGGTGYSWADRQTGWDDPALGKHSGWRHPSWVDNDTVLLANPTHAFNFDVILDTISDGDSGNLVHNWFSDTAQDNPGVGGGDVSRDRTKMAFVTGENDSTLTLYGVPSFPTSFPDSEAPVSTRPLICYRYSNPPGGKYSQPTFSPDGGSVAWSNSDGVHVATVPALAGGCTLDGATPTPPLVIPGGSEPDWGPADVPTRPVVKPGKTAKLSVSVTRATRRAVTLRVKVPGKGRVTASAGRARTSKAVKRAGTVTLKLKGRPAKVKVTFKPASGATQTRTIRIGK